MIERSFRIKRAIDVRELFREVIVGYCRIEQQLGFAWFAVFSY